MKRAIAALVVAGAMSVAGVAPAFAAEHHPPKFGVKSTQCTGGSNHPQCPGSH